MCFFSSWLLFAWEFSIRHPGTVLVLIGVAGEGAELIAKKFCHEWFKKQESLLEWLGLLFWLMVVVGLLWEFGEIRQSEKEASELTARAATNELRVAVLSNETVHLSIDLESAKSNNFKLAKQVFGLTAQTEQISTNIEQVRNMVNSPEITINTTKIQKMNWMKMGVIIFRNERNSFMGAPVKVEVQIDP